MLQLWEALKQLYLAIENLVRDVPASSLLILAWVAWWLWAVNWKRAWPVLARGAWAPLVLLIVITALSWSMIAPRNCSCLGFVTIANFWWQLGYVVLIAGLAFFCGWLQEVFGIHPIEVNLEPVEHHHGHDHGHGGHHEHGSHS